MTDNEKFLARSWYILLGVLGFMVTALGYALWTQIVPEKNESMAFTLIGAILTKFGDVIAWRINSSKGSSDKSNPPGAVTSSTTTTTTATTPKPPDDSQRPQV